MRFATVRTPRGLRLHVKGTGGYVDLADASGDASLSDINALAAGGESALGAARAASAQGGVALAREDFAPVTPNPNRVLCLGVNYAEHAIEGGRYIAAEDAFDAILGYAVMNDGSAREWQRKATQWTPGKNFEGTMPIGPELVTVDEVDVTDLAIRTTLNGEVMQDARTSMMIVTVAKAVEYFSGFTTLRPGDVIATGTPGGVGFARTPPVWLTPGDTIEVFIEGVGTISNTVVAEEGAPADWPWQPLQVDTTNF